MAECYVCDRWKYTLFMLKGAPGTTLRGTFRMLNNSCQDEVELVDIREFASKLAHKTNSNEKNFQTLMEANPHFKEFSKAELRYFDLRFKQDDKALYQEHQLWHKLMMKQTRDLDYQSFPNKPACFDLKEHVYEEDAHENPDMYVFADFLRPTKRVEKLVFFKGGRRTHQEFFISEVRQKDLPLNQLIDFTKQMTEIPFEKDKSVFKSWVKDSPVVLKKALNFDLGYWKAAKFVRDQTDFKQCCSIIQTHFESLKHIFVNLISSDNYPHIGWNEFVAFCRSVDILDGTLPTSTVDRMFIATKVGGPKEGTQNTLFRHEFLEIMIRISNAKYRETKVVGTYSEALKMMLDSIIDKFAPRPWQEFRDSDLWTVKVDQIFKANLPNLEKVYSTIFPRYGGQMCFQTCIDIFTRQLDMEISEKVTRFCFGMSKMTVKDEISNHKDYNKLVFPEFLEFIGRLAHAKYLDDEETPLDQKIELLLDNILPFFGCRRQQVVEEQGRDDTSEESMIQGDDYKLADEQLDSFTDHAMNKVTNFLAGESL